MLDGLFFSHDAQFCRCRADKPTLLSSDLCRRRRRLLSAPGVNDLSLIALRRRFTPVNISLLNSEGGAENAPLIGRRARLTSQLTLAH